MPSCYRTVLNKACGLRKARLLRFRSSVIFPKLPLPSNAAKRRLATTAQCRVHELRSSDWPVSYLPFAKPLIKLHSPDDAKHNDPRAWTAILEGVIAHHLKHETMSDNPDNQPEQVDGRDISHFLIQAQKAGIDVLQYMALNEDRWDAVLWVVKLVAALPKSQLALEALIVANSGQSWLKDLALTNAIDDPVWARAIEAPVKHDRSLSHLTASQIDVSNSGWNLRRGGLGQIWRSLGRFILAAIHEHARKSDIIMERVRQILAILHHAGVVPESVYQYVETGDIFAPRQPPTLHLLSSRILASLSDAAWNAHQAAATAAATKAGVNLDSFVHPAPGSMYKVQVLALGPEIWLELVLWACLHGPWVLDGAAILRQLAQYGGTETWSLIRWNDVLSVSGMDGSTTRDLLRMKLQLDAQNPKLRVAEHQTDRLRVQKTISTELVAAYIDGLINVISVGVGSRGAPVTQVLRHIKEFKNLLDRARMSLGTQTWDSVMIRILESEGIKHKQATHAMTRIMELVQPYSPTTESAAMYRETEQPPARESYFLQPTAAPLGLHHQIIRDHLVQRNLSETLRAFQQLQNFTDVNKRRSIEKFSEKLQDKTHSREKSEYKSSYICYASDFPNYHPRLPNGILAALFDLLTESTAFDVGRWLVYSRDIDGPVVTRQSYSNSIVAGSLIRFATAAVDKELLSAVLEKQIKSRGWREGSFQLPMDILSVFFESQVVHRRWESVQTILDHLNERREASPVTFFASLLARELLRMSRETSSSANTSFLRAQALFQSILQGDYGVATKAQTAELLSILGILSTVQGHWLAFCTPYLGDCGWRPLKLPTAYFDILLQGIVEGHGSLTGLHVFTVWCEEATRKWKQNLASDFGVSRMASARKKSIDQTRRTKVLLENNGEVMFVGAVRPSVGTIKIVIAGHLQGRVAQPKSAKETVTQWSIASLWRLGLETEDIKVEVNGLIPQS